MCMGFDFTNTIATGIGVSAFITTVVAVFLFTVAYHERLARIMAFNMVATALWAWFSFFPQIVGDAWLAREFIILSFLAQIAAQMLTITFFYQYALQVRKLAVWEKALCIVLVVCGAIFSVLYIIDGVFGTYIMLGGVQIQPGITLTPDRAPGLDFFLAFYYLLTITFGIIMARSVILQKGAARRSGAMFTATVIIAYLMGSAGFLTWYDIVSPFSLLISLTLPFYIVGAFYSITNYRLFNLRIGAASLFIFAMWAFMFLRVLLRPSLEAAAMDIAILGVFIIVGLLFIRSITHEFTLRLRLEEVFGELRHLNRSLESKVAARTKELSRSRAHTEAVVEHSPVGLIEVNKDGVIVRINQVASALFGVRSESVVGTPLRASAAFVSVFTGNLSEGMFDAAVTAPRKREVEITVAPLILEEGEGHVAIIHDVTDTRSLERAKSEFLATAAHQLRTPLAALKWVFNLLEDEKLSEQDHEVVLRGASGVANMERVTEELLLSVRTSAGVASYTFAPIDLKTVITSAATVLESVADKKKIRLSLQVPEGLPLLSLDSERMMFAIQNLVDNAIKYTPEGGQVSLTVIEEADHVTVSVKDSGIGITEEDQKHLFERFFRTARAVEMFANGSGLGLFIVKGIVEAHGGTLSVQSTEGKGSTFTFTIPKER